MRKLLLMLFTPLLLTACPAPGEHDPTGGLATCGVGHTPVNIKYGDSQIKVTPPYSKMKTNSTLVFNLIPDKRASDLVEFETVEVIIEGKTDSGQWINTKGTYSGSLNHKLTVCIESSLAPGLYEYLVKVEGVGQLDPRAEVEN